MNDKNYQEIMEQDRASVLHPFTQLKDLATGKIDPTVIVDAKGIRVTDSTGREYIDSFAGLYCMNLGYGRTEIADAISEQAHKLGFFHTYAGHTTDQLARLSSRLVKMAPGKMSKVFYGQSGSDANETQAKLVWYYNNLRGKPNKKKIIARERAYHGSSIISGSMTGMSFYHNNMDLPLPIILRTGVPHYYWGSNPGETEEQFSARRAAELEELILKEGADTIGALIGEPVLGSGGIVPPPKGYWTEIKRVLDKYDILLIADEVVCGFGRTGKMFGCDHFGLEPDLITCAKGLTSAYFPLSAVIVSEKVYKVFEDGADKVGPFSHGYTYSGHPIGLATANAVLDIIERENIPEHAEKVGAYFLQSLKETFGNCPIVGEVRGIGLLAALEFVADPEKKVRFDASLKVGARISQAARDRNLIARAMPHGDILGFSPPLTITIDEVNEIVELTRQAVEQVVGELRAEGVIA
ncbi:aminotransferase [Pseudomonas sp. NPDC089401]|uniref:aminotransferase n=1 Tax=Pseudomonas sp. NPDC089401 TaxID=3364462 RepID=UPI003830EDA3